MKIMLINGSSTPLYEQIKNAIKEKIYEAIIHRNQLQYMGELAYNRIMEEYNIDIVCKKMLSLLK